MSDLIAKCGANCNRCPSYKKNLVTAQDRQRCSDGWHKYLGFRLSPEKLLCCDGCLVANEMKPVRYYRSGCRIRKCAERNSAQTCAHCSEFPCEDVRRMWTGYTKKAVAARLGIQASEIPEEDHLAFIEPYEGMKHLKAVRASLNPSDIVKNRKVAPIRARIVDFPEYLRMRDGDIASFKNVHGILRNVLTAPAKTYARQEFLKNRRRHILGFLWLMGHYGDLREEDGGWLVLDGARHGSRPQCRWLVIKRDNSLHTAVRQGSDLLRDRGIDWKYEPSGSRWLLKLTFNKKAGGLASLKALTTYTLALAKEYGEPVYAGNSRLKGEAFVLFSKADMRILEAADLRSVEGR